MSQENGGTGKKDNIIDFKAARDKKQEEDARKQEEVKKLAADPTGARDIFEKLKEQDTLVGKMMSEEVIQKFSTDKELDQASLQNQRERAAGFSNEDLLNILKEYSKNPNYFSTTLLLAAAEEYSKRFPQL